MSTNTQMQPAPRVTLSNGLTVANFSSPHPFTFTTGEVIPRCDPARVEMSKLEVIEAESEGIKGTTDLRLKWEITAVILDELLKLDDDEAVDVVLVPLPVMQALKEAAAELEDVSPVSTIARVMRKVRVIRCADRETKAIYPDRFCR